jgi:hypothetical protein
MFRWLPECTDECLLAKEVTKKQIPGHEKAINIPVNDLDHNQLLNCLAATKCYMPSD